MGSKVLVVTIIKTKPNSHLGSGSLFTKKRLPSLCDCCSSHRKERYMSIAYEPKKQYERETRVWSQQYMSMASVLEINVIPSVAKEIAQAPKIIFHAEFAAASPAG
ncbi:hypothetical protein BT93_E1123 [Corymbia citriodora subsp. variegata]|nr:hypothetical protein BT93_E1123 [Corymbia citriodora subsp. variegata]